MGRHSPNSSGDLSTRDTVHFVTGQVSNWGDPQDADFFLASLQTTPEKGTFQKHTNTNTMKVHNTFSRESGCCLIACLPPTNWKFIFLSTGHGARDGARPRPPVSMKKRHPLCWELVVLKLAKKGQMAQLGYELLALSQLVGDLWAESLLRREGGRGRKREGGSGQGLG